MTAKQHLEKYITADKVTALQMDYEWQTKIQQLPIEQQKEASEALANERLNYAQSTITTLNAIASAIDFPAFVAKHSS
jgi:hypothetical protein